MWLLSLALASLPHVLACCNEDRTQNPPATHRLVIRSKKKYPIVKTGDKQDCDYLNEPCRDINDVWGYEFDENGTEKSFAVVGMSNGLDILDLTDFENIKDIHYFHGCENVWRDIKRYRTTLYVISEYTQTCACDIGPCQEHMEVISPPSLAKWYPATEGRLTPALSEVGDVVGSVWPVAVWEEAGCLAHLTTPNFPNPVFLIPLGGCETSQKIKFAQEAGAVAVLMVNPVDNIIYPGMEGPPFDLTIPAMLIGHSDGNRIKLTVEGGQEVVVTLTADNKQPSDFFESSEGLWVVDMSDPYHPTRNLRKDWFNWAHNLHIDQERGILYTVGMSGFSKEDPTRRVDVENGGFMVFRVTDAREKDPVLVGKWNTSYVHDMTTKFCQGRWLAFTADIYQDNCYVVDVTDPAYPVTLVRWAGRNGAAHNIWMDDTCEVAYVTHEEPRAPISVWRFRRDPADGLLRYDVAPRYQGILSINQFGGSLPHNVHVEKNILWASYYAEGVIAWDISVPWKPIFMAQTMLEDKEDCMTWGVYPHLSKDNRNLAYASDITCGFYAVELLPLSAPITTRNGGVVLGLSLSLAVILMAAIYLYTQLKKARRLGRTTPMTRAAAAQEKYNTLEIDER
eukprot:gb/GEZN01003487.1/.p1 GENE.gb/GEZN01003487.1/~~gb/GEZN01003487.1/.p1  ORF type:complete len:623 (+),score=85.89 gb/GEZN01003487.1/:76-1944(+)